MKVYVSLLLAVLIFASGCASSHMGSTAGVARSPKWTAKGLTPLEDIDTAAPARESRSWSVRRAVPTEQFATAPGAAQRTPASSPAKANATRAYGPGDDGMVEIPLYREQLQVGKRVVSKGGVVLRKIVETDTRTVPVDLRQEEIVIERVGPDQAQEFQGRGSAPGSTTGTGAFQDREVLIELNREEPVVQKSAAVTEVVRARKTIDTRNEVVSGTVRRETIDIDRASANQDRAGASSGEQVGFAGSSGTSVQGSGEGGSRGVQQPAREEQTGAELFLHREELQVGKRIVPAGQVTLRKNVTSEEVSRPIELREEDIRVERAPLSGDEPSQARANAFAPREIYIPLNREVPTVEKKVELIEVIRAGKRIDTEQQNVSGEVRSERVEVSETRAGDSRTGQGSAAAFERGSSNTNDTDQIQKPHAEKR
ncbi:MAG: YsnF/AvaK domain-containing protein [Limisphaerales bacterium]